MKPLESLLGIPVEISEVFELEGTYYLLGKNRIPQLLYVHVSRVPIDLDEAARYALIASQPQQGTMDLVTIDNQLITKLLDPTGRDAASYERGINRIIKKVYVPKLQIPLLPTWSQISQINGLTFKGPYFPE